MEPAESTPARLKTEVFTERNWGIPKISRRGKEQAWCYPVQNNGARSYAQPRGESVIGKKPLGVDEDTDGTFEALPQFLKNWTWQYCACPKISPPICAVAPGCPLPHSVLV